MEFRVLGKLEVVRDGRVVDLGARRQRALLGLLLTSPNSVFSTDQILDGLWGEDGGADKQTSLWVYVSALRTALEPNRAKRSEGSILLTRAPGYVVEISPDCIDSVRFERLVAQGRALVETDPAAASLVLGEALALWRGRAFEDFTYESFAQGEIVRLEALRLEAVQERVGADLERGMSRELVPELESLVRQHPLQEHLTGQFMVALYRSGRQADALRVYQLLKGRLGEEFGVEPSTRIRKLHEQIVTGDEGLAGSSRPVSDVTAGLIGDADPSDIGEHRFVGVDDPIRLWQVGAREFPPSRTSAAVAGNLPDTLDTFIGRVEDLSVLSGLISAHRLVTVVGVGGIGKTRLAVEAGHGVQSDFVGGVWFVDLALASSDGAVVEEAASLFGLQALEGLSVEDRLIDFLRSRSALLVFDNCEHVMRTAARLIGRLLKACPEVKVVATSREALLLQGEHVMALGPLAMADDSGDGGPLDAVELFVDRLTAGGGPAIGDDEDRAVVLEICRQLDGVPLAIELAAGRARTLGTTDVLARLGERLRLLSGGWRTGVGRQQTLSATLDWSYVLLDGREQVVFDRLAVFVGWFTLDDAIAVAGDPTLSDLDVLDAVSALVDKSMCTHDLEATPARYRYLETMRSYGRDHLSKSARLIELRDRHAAHLAASARDTASAFIGPHELESLRRVERLIPELRAALGWAFERHLDDVIDGIATLAVPMGMKGFHEVSGWFYDLRHDLPDRPAVQEAAVHHALYSKSNNAETRRLAHRLIEMTNDGQWLAWLCLASAEFNEGHFDGAVDYLTRCYEIGEAQTDNLRVHTINPTMSAVFLVITGRDPGDLVEQGFTRARELSWSGALAFAHYAAGLAVVRSDPVDSLDHLHRGLDLAVEVNNHAVEALCRMMLHDLQATSLPPSELASALISQLQDVRERGDSNNAFLLLSQATVLLDQAARWRTAALICGWLDGRSSRMIQTIGAHEAAVASIERALGDRYGPLVRQGSDMTITQVLDTACDELSAIAKDAP